MQVPSEKHNMLTIFGTNNFENLIRNGDRLEKLIRIQELLISWVLNPQRTSLKAVARLVSLAFDIHLTGKYLMVPIAFRRIFI